MGKSSCSCLMMMTFLRSVNCKIWFDIFCFQFHKTNFQVLLLRKYFSNKCNAMLLCTFLIETYSSRLHKGPLGNFTCYFILYNRINNYNEWQWVTTTWFWRHFSWLFYLDLIFLATMTMMRFWLAISVIHLKKYSWRNN